MHTRARILLLIVAALALSACAALPSPAAQPPAGLPNPPRAIEVAFPAGIAVEPPRSGATVSVNPDRPFFFSDLRLSDGPGVLNGNSWIAWVPPGQPFDASFRFENGSPNARQMTVLCLVNYRQVPCRPDEPTLPVEVASGSAVELPLQFAGLEPGGHMLTVAAIGYLPVPEWVYAHPVPLGELVMRSPEIFYSHSLTLFAGGYAMPQVSTEALPAGPDDPNSTGNLFVMIAPPSVQSALDEVPHPNLIPNSGFQGALVEARPGETLSFHLVSGHDEQAASYTGAQSLGLPVPRDGMPVVLAAFLDDVQIPLEAGGAPGPRFGIIPRSQELVLPISFVAPAEPGVYSLNLIYQESPFLPRGTLSAAPDDTLRYNVHGAVSQLAISPRVFIRVVAP